MNPLLLIAALQGGLDVIPTPASTMAPEVDHIYYALCSVTLFFSVLIFLLIFIFMIKYRRRSEAIPPPTPEPLSLEITWTVIPILISICFFWWAARVFFEYREAPPGAIEIFVVGKQWMWHIQHPEGPREINELHIPVNVPIKLTLASQDVIHDFFVPAFRQKMDVVPGRYTSEWFEATKVGRYHFFCAQYCGTAHSGMIGWVDVMRPEDYSAWLRANATAESTSQSGGRLFSEFGCAGCHVANGSGLGPSLVGVFGQPTKLQNGESRVVDESFIRQMLQNPLPIAGYPRVMPIFRGQLDEEQIMNLVAYIRSLSGVRQGGRP